MTHRSSFLAAGWLVIVGLLGVAIAAPSALATRPDPEHKVTICHRTHSDANPYRMLTVDIASSGHLKGGHDTEHQGPIWDPTLKAQKVEWGDIIPPYTYGDFVYPGANWTDAGQAIWANDCEIPEPSPTIESQVPSAPVESEAPTGSVEAATGERKPTPPATDVGGAAGTPSGGGWWLAIGTLVTLASTALVTARIARVRT